MELENKVYLPIAVRAKHAKSKNYAIPKKEIKMNSPDKII